MSDNSKTAFQAVTGFQGGVSVGIYADTYDEFVSKCFEVYGEEGKDIADGLYASLQAESLRGVKKLENEAAASLTQQAPPQQGAAPQWGGQQPPQQFVPQQQPFQQQAGPPPGQTCDPKDPRKTKWVPAGVSSKTGRPYKGFWADPSA